MWQTILLFVTTAHAQERSFDLATAIAEGPPMTADRAAEMAVRANPTIERARALRRASEASVSRARAQMLPRIDLTARYTHLDGFPDGQISTATDPETLAEARALANMVSDPAARALFLGNIEGQASGGATISIPRDQFYFGASLSWAVSDLFFALMPALDSAEASARAEEARVAATEAQVRRNAREAYYSLARARGSLAVALEARRQAQAQLEQIESGVRAGFLTEADRLGAVARVAATDQAVASANAGVEIADAALRTMMAADDGPVYGIGEPVLAEDSAELAPVAELTARALAARPEVTAIEQAIEAQHAAGRATAASAYPHVIVGAGASYSSPNQYVIPPSGDFEPTWQVGATLAWSPNDTWTAVHRGQELDAQEAATREQLGELERGVRLEVRQAHALIRSAREAMVAAVAAREAAEAAYESRSSQLDAGHATTADLFAAEGQLNQARLSELDAAIQLRLARTRLDYATGVE
jgi:outer membrane protein TolC